MHMCQAQRASLCALTRTALAMALASFPRTKKTKTKKLAGRGRAHAPPLDPCLPLVVF